MKIKNNYEEVISTKEIKECIKLIKNYKSYLPNKMTIGCNPNEQLDLFCKFSSRYHIEGNFIQITEGIFKSCNELFIKKLVVIAMVFHELRHSFQNKKGLFHPRFDIFQKDALQKDAYRFETKMMNSNKDIINKILDIRQDWSLDEEEGHITLFPY